jgi:hypothetical protein
MDFDLPSEFDLSRLRASECEIRGLAVENAL